jgi:hypothetical protein
MIVNLRKSSLLFLPFVLLIISCTMEDVRIPTVQTELHTPSPFFASTSMAQPEHSTTETSQMTVTPTPNLDKTTQLTPHKPTGASAISTEESSMTKIHITTGSASFSAKLYDNETTRVLLAKFPLSLNMADLNGQEKYYHLLENLPSPATEKPATIRAGEIMLWSSDSLVLFYKTFSNSYGGYVRLGYVEDATGLAAALGGGSVHVTFE